MRLCEYPGCSGKYAARGCCSRHYYQLSIGKGLSPLRPSRKERSEAFDRGLRSCSQCREVKPLAEFAKGYSSCRSCHAMSGRLRKYNLTVETLEAMIEGQQGNCGMCQTAVSNWHVDHDHGCCPGYSSCGSCVRGLLCGPCNRGLGHYERYHKDAARYLSNRV